MTGGHGHSTTARGRGGAWRRAGWAAACPVTVLAAVTACSGVSSPRTPAEAAWPTATAGKAKDFVVWEVPWRFEGTRENARVGQQITVGDDVSDTALSFTVIGIRPDQPCPAVNYAPKPGYRTVVLELRYLVRRGADVQLHPEASWFADGGEIAVPEMVDVRRAESNDCLAGWAVPLEIRRGEPVEGAIMLQVPEGADRLVLVMNALQDRAWEYELPVRSAQAAG